MTGADGLLGARAEAAAPILVAVDHAGSANDALDWASAEAAMQGCPLLVVHAVTPRPALDPAFAGAMNAYRAAANSAAERLLSDAAARAHAVAADLVVNTRVLDGTVAWALRRETHAARLLVVGSAGRRDGLRSLLTGSVPGELTEHASCPVVVLRRLDPVRAAARVVVGVNRSRSCDAALGFAFQAARQRNIPLHVVHVQAKHPPTEHSLASWRARFPEIPVVTKLLIGDPAPALLAEASGAALLVLGSRGRGHRLGRLLGSVGQGVLQDAGCPVAIVRLNQTSAASTADASWFAMHNAPR